MLSILFLDYFLGNQEKIRSTFRQRRKKKDWFAKFHFARALHGELPHCRPHTGVRFQKCLQNSGKIPCEALCAEATNLDFSKCDSWRCLFENIRTKLIGLGGRNPPFLHTPFHRTLVFRAVLKS